MPFLPTLASKHGAEIDRILVFVHVLMAVLFFVWLFYFTIVLFRFRRGKNPNALPQGAKTKVSYYLEVGVVAVEVSLLVGLAIPFWARQVLAQNSPPENAVRVRIVAQQYAWNVHYPGEDGVFGRTALDRIDTASNPLGLDYEDPAAKDDIFKLNELFLPVDRPAVIDLSSRDVIHSFNLPEFRVKQDTIPGLGSRVVFEPTMTTAQFRKIKNDTSRPDRTFEIACAQLCGLGHYKMKGFLTVLTAEEFEKWLVDNKPDPSLRENVDPLFN
jgi:cytochrome c oxidase subunit 2